MITKRIPQNNLHCTINNLIHLPKKSLQVKFYNVKHFEYLPLWMPIVITVFLGMIATVFFQNPLSLFRRYSWLYLVFINIF